MAKNKRRRGVKTYRPHGIATFIYVIFGLAVLAGLAAFVLLPMFTYTKNGTPTEFNGLEFVGFTVRQYFSTATASFQPKYDAFLEYFGSTQPTNEALKVIFTFHQYIELAFGAIFGLVAIFAFVEFLLVFAMLIFGKSNHPGGIKTFAWLIFWFFAANAGLIYMYFFFYQQIIGEVQAAAGTSDTIAINYDMKFLIILGGLFLVCIILSIIWRAGFKDRVAMSRGKKKGKDDDGDDEESTIVPYAYTQPMPNPQQPQQPQQFQQLQQQPVNNYNGGSSVITIGDRAYTKNTEITNAAIPEGITSLGSSAFANCVNLTSVSLPGSLQEIGFNCFFNTPKLTDITFNGTVERWKCVKRGSNWLAKSGTKTIRCSNGKINVNPNH